MKPLTVASFCAGVGGIDIAFEQNGFKTIYANEIDPIPSRTFEENFDIKVDKRDIKNVKASDIPDFDVLISGFPCQPFSIAGYRQGFDDETGRGTIFFELERIIKAKRPKVIMLENVKNLVGHDKGNTFRVILEKLEKAGYYVKYQVLNAMEYGNIPQNRERIYVVGFKSKTLCQKFEFPKPIELTTKLSDIIDYHSKVDNKYYYTDSCSFYEILKRDMTSQDTVYQWRRTYVRENKNKVCPTLTANMGTGGHNVPLILTDNGIRKLTPKECFNVQGFPLAFKLPRDTANTHLYKQAGNSVVVPVISRIAAAIQAVL